MGSRIFWASMSKSSFNLVIKDKSWDDEWEWLGWSPSIGILAKLQWITETSVAIFSGRMKKLGIYLIFGESSTIGWNLSKIRSVYSDKSVRVDQVCSCWRQIWITCGYKYEPSDLSEAKKSIGQWNLKCEHIILFLISVVLLANGFSWNWQLHESSSA